MIPGLSAPALTAIHVVISLFAIAIGLLAFLTLARGKWLKRWHDWFLAATIATSLSGFLFPFKGVTPAFAVGLLSLVILIAACVMLYKLKLKGWARLLYVVTGMVALYFNIFVLVIQAFQKIPALAALAPTQSEAPFVVVQAVVLIGTIILGIIAALSSRRHAIAA